MVVLSDKDIKEYIKKGKIIIDNLNEDQIRPCSVDLRLGNTFRVFTHTSLAYIDTRKGLDDNHTEIIEKKDDESFIVHPGELILATTVEYVKIPNDLVATLDGRSSLGRLGLVVHSTANSFDPGFEGHLTLEITNISNIPVALWPKQRICRFTFTKLSSPSENPYNKLKDAKYHKQKGPDASKINLDL